MCCIKTCLRKDLAEQAGPPYVAFKSSVGVFYSFGVPYDSDKETPATLRELSLFSMEDTL